MSNIQMKPLKIEKPYPISENPKQNSFEASNPFQKNLSMKRLKLHYRKGNKLVRKGYPKRLTVPRKGAE